MRIELILIGDTQKGFIADGIQEYTKRLKHYIKFEQKIIKSIKNSHKLSFDEQKKREAELIKNVLIKKSIVILLDENGKEFTSPQFAKYLEKNLNTGQHITFVVGGAFGFSEELKNKYPLVALSKMTFSHQMIRLFFIEQLYRAFTILKGENYHH